MPGTVAQYQQGAFSTPVNGTVADATVVLSNDNATRTKHNSHDSDATIHVQSSTLASRPGPSTAQRLWFTTDGLRAYMDTGAAWQELAYVPLVGSTTVTGAIVSTARLSVLNGSSNGGGIEWDGDAGVTSPQSNPAGWSAGMQLARLRISNPGIPGVSTDFQMTHYQFGFAMEYTGIIEIFSDELSVHCRTGSGVPALLYVGDELDAGGWRFDGHGGARVETFGGAANYDMSFRLPDTTKKFTFAQGATELVRIGSGTNALSALGDLSIDSALARVYLNTSGGSTGLPAYLTFQNTNITATDKWYVGLNAHAATSADEYVIVAAGVGTAMTIRQDLSVTLAGNTTIAGGKQLILTGATVTGAPTWSSSQAITLSTAAQPNITSLGTLTGITIQPAGTSHPYVVGAWGAGATYNFLSLNNDLSGTTGVGVAGGGGTDGNIWVQAGTNGDIIHRVNGTGNMRLATAYVAGAPAATGYITVKDSGGTTYKILVST